MSVQISAMRAPDHLNSVSHTVEGELIGRRAPLVAMAGMILLTACGESFVAFEDNDLVFSIYGYLDPARDTQWLRVTPIRTSIETSPGQVDAVVTIEEVETGRTIVMSDSLFGYQPLDPSGTYVYAHNFSTSEPILEGYTYRVTASRSDGTASSVTVPIPVEEEEIWVTVRKRQGISPNFGRSLDRLRIIGVEHLAMVETVEDTPAECDYSQATWRELQQRVRSEGSGEDDLYFQLGWPPVAPRPSYLGFPPCGRGVQRIAITVTTSPWPYDPSLDRRVTGHPNIAGNVVNGIGFVAGVMIREFPYEPEQCTLTIPAEFCDIVFNRDSATLEGTIVDSCEMEPLVDATVRLEELSGVRIRPAAVDSTGNFRIRGLDPGVSYRLTVMRDRFRTHQTSLTFSPGEVRDLPNIILAWEEVFDPCQFQ